MDFQGIVRAPRPVAGSKNCHPLTWRAWTVANALDALLVGLKDEDPRLRARCAELLGFSQDRKAISNLIGALADKESRVRERAWRALDEIGRPAVEPLLAAMESPNPEIRGRAANLLGFDLRPRRLGVRPARTPSSRCLRQLDKCDE